MSLQLMQGVILKIAGDGQIRNLLGLGGSPTDAQIGQHIHPGFVDYEELLDPNGTSILPRIIVGPGNDTASHDHSIAWEQARVTCVAGGKSGAVAYDPTYLAESLKDRVRSLLDKQSVYGDNSLLVWRYSRPEKPAAGEVNIEIRHLWFDVAEDD